MYTNITIFIPHSKEFWNNPLNQNLFIRRIKLEKTSDRICSRSFNQMFKNLESLIRYVSKKNKNNPYVGQVISAASEFLNTGREEYDKKVKGKKGLKAATREKLYIWLVYLQLMAEDRVYIFNSAA